MSSESDTEIQDLSAVDQISELRKKKIVGLVNDPEGVAREKLVGINWPVDGSDRRVLLTVGDTRYLKAKDKPLAGMV